jgi:hypothetical protein
MLLVGLQSHFMLQYFDISIFIYLFRIESIYSLTLLLSADSDAQQLTHYATLQLLLITKPKKLGAQ